MSAATRRVVLFSLLVAVASSCGTSPSTPEPYVLESDTYTLAPGEERYFCYAVTLPASRGEIDITAFRPDYGPGTHHIFFGYTLAPEPEGFSECPVLSRTTWVPLFLGGQRTSDLELPPSTVMRLTPGTQIFMQLHLQNPTSDTITSRTSMHLDLTQPSPSNALAGVFGYDNRTVAIPARATNVQTTMSCTPGHRLPVFAVLGHMHNLGQELELFRGDVTGERLFDEVFSFSEQPTTAVDFVVEATDTITLRCTHTNPSDVDVLYGESSTTEMCAAIMYYAPAVDPVDGCIMAPP